MGPVWLIFCNINNSGNSRGGDGGDGAGIAARSDDGDDDGGDDSRAARVAHLPPPTGQAAPDRPFSAGRRHSVSVPATRQTNWLSSHRPGLTALVQLARRSSRRVPPPRPEVQRSSFPFISSNLDIGHMTRQLPTLENLRSFQQVGETFWVSKPRPRPETSATAG